MSQFLHQRPLTNPLTDPTPITNPSSISSQKPMTMLNRTALLSLLALLIMLGVVVPWFGTPQFMFTKSSAVAKWRRYTLEEAASFVAKNGTVIVCAVSYPYLPFLNNWLISISRQKHQDQVLVIAEDYATLNKINKKWPGHAVLVPPAADTQTAHKFGSQVVQLLFIVLHFQFCCFGFMLNTFGLLV